MRRTGTDFKRDHVNIIVMSAAPDFKRQIRKIDGFIVSDTNHVQVFHGRKCTAAIDRVSNCGIVVARQKDDRKPRYRHHRGGAFDQWLRYAMMVERIARQNDHIGGVLPRRVKHAGKAGRAVAAMQACRIFMVNVEIGAVNDNNVAGGRISALTES